MADGDDTISVRRDEWKLFLQTVTALVEAHTTLLDHSRKLRTMRGQVSENTTWQQLWAICEECGRRLEKNAKFCDLCGLEVVDSEKSTTWQQLWATCEECGRRLEKNAKFCDLCGLEVVD